MGNSRRIGIIITFLLLSDACFSLPIFLSAFSFVLRNWLFLFVGLLLKNLFRLKIILRGLGCDFAGDSDSDDGSVVLKTIFPAFSFSLNLSSR